MRYISRTRDDGTRIQVEYTVESWGSPPSWTDPGDPVIVEILAVIDDDGEGAEIKLTEAEMERIDQEICEIVDEDGPEPMDDDVI